MRFLVITNAPTLKKNNLHGAYAPYVNEMDIWFKYVDEVVIVSPTSYNQELLLSSFKKQPNVVSIPSLNFTSFLNILKSIIFLPIITFKLIVEMYKADHIHLRCPGNIGLLGCFVQLFFPKKNKTTKYAGNWNPKSKQPLSYRVQKWILSSTLLTKNMQVLVYGKWKNQTKNIKPFFTATYKQSEIELIEKRDYTSVLKFVFVGSLVIGKRPLLTIQIIEDLYKQGHHVTLDMFGDGHLKLELLEYVSKNNLESYITIHGNQTKATVKEALKRSHFSILPSKSEGWPKAIAEAMFFGVIPIVTKISCVPYMLNDGERGVLIEPKLSVAVKSISTCLENKENLHLISKKATLWSQKYTLDVFETEISKLINI